MFACNSGDGIGLRWPAVAPFAPRGAASTRDWIQINRAAAAEYAKDLDRFKVSLEFAQGRWPR